MSTVLWVTILNVAIQAVLKTKGLAVLKRALLRKLLPKLKHKMKSSSRHPKGTADNLAVKVAMLVMQPIIAEENILVEKRLDQILTIIQIQRVQIQATSLNVPKNTKLFTKLVKRKHKKPSAFATRKTTVL
ncbi:hypothetical protein D3C72_1547290 [compost metagenome]